MTDVSARDFSGDDCFVALPDSGVDVRSMAVCLCCSYVVHMLSVTDPDELLSVNCNPLNTIFFLLSASAAGVLLSVSVHTVVS